MRHRKQGKKFSKIRGRRRSFMRNLTVNLLRHGKIETTEIRAKAVRPVAERLVTLAKTDTVARRRLVLSRVGDRKIVKKLFEDLGPRYKERKGGYLRIVRLAEARKRDGVRKSRVEFV